MANARLCTASQSASHSASDALPPELPQHLWCLLWRGRAAAPTVGLLHARSDVQKGYAVPDGLMQQENICSECGGLQV